MGNDEDEYYDEYESEEDSWNEEMVKIALEEEGLNP